MKRLDKKKLLDLVRIIDFPPLRLKISDQVPRVKSNDNRNKPKPDYFAEIEWENKSYKFVVEIKNQATPKALENIIYQLRRITLDLQNTGDNRVYYPMLIAPFLNEEILERLASENMSGIDLSGNGLVVVPGKIFVYRFGAKNKFSSSAPIKNVFRGISSIIPRVFFSKQEYRSVAEVLDEITKRSGKTTLATVSKVLKALDEELIISRNEKIRLIDAKGLLKKLRENYRRPISERTIAGKVENIESVLIQISKNADRNDFLCAISEPRRYATMASSNETTKVFTQNLDKSLSQVKITETDRFPNLEIIESREVTVFFDRRQENTGVYYTSPLEVFLELASLGKREQEIADQIAEELLNFRY